MTTKCDNKCNKIVMVSNKTVRQINKAKITTKATILKEKNNKKNLIKTKMHNEHET